MRKSTVFILAAAVLSAAFICLACREINALSSAVSYESTAVIGDSRAADGLTVGLSASSGNMLCWDTRFRPDGDPETDFRFDQSKSRRSVRYDDYGLYLYFPCNFGMGGDIDLSDERYDSAGYYLPMLKEIASRAPSDGREYSETVSMRDYYSYFPLEADLHLNASMLEYVDDTVSISIAAGSGPSNPISQAVARHFLVPVPDDYSLTVSVVKDTDGNLRKINVDDSGNDPQFYLDTTFSAMADDGCFFTFSCPSEFSGLSDTAAVSGIYFLPYTDYMDDTYSNQTIKVVGIDSIKFIYGLQTGELPQSLTLSPDGSRLLLITESGGAYRLTVLDSASFSVLQQLPLMSESSTTWINNVWTYDDFILALTAGGRFALASVENGIYSVAIVSDLPDELYADMQTPSPGIDFNGEKLAIAASISQIKYDRPAYSSFCLLIYDQSGLLYCADYISSLDVPSSNYGLRASLLDDVPIQAVWQP